LIVCGRFVPGLRFVVGATMGLSRYPYRRFLLWDAIGGTAWATSTCLVSYAFASLIEDRPIVSIAVSGLMTTALLALLYRPLKRTWQAANPEAAEAAGWGTN
jgi:membrane protein DedA with SNARE-associated domain